MFPKCRNSRRSEHCQGGGGGRRGHYLDKRSGAVQCQRQTRSTHGWQQLLPRFCGHCRTFCVCLPYGKSHGNKFPNLFRNTVSIKPVASARRQASPSFSNVQAVSNRRPDIVRVLSEARLAKHISSLRRTACRPKSVRLHAFHAALVVDVAAFLAVAVVGSCGILAANIVGVCGIVCGNGRGWLRRSCGKISSKPAASVVDQPLTDVRGKASPLFLWVQANALAQSTTLSFGL